MLSRRRPVSGTSIGILSCTTAMVIVGASIAIAPTLAGYPVLAGQAWRYLLAGLILLGILASRSGSLARVSPGNAVRLVAIAATGL